MGVRGVLFSFLLFCQVQLTLGPFPAVPLGLAESGCAQQGGCVLSENPSGSWSLQGSLRTTETLPNTTICWVHAALHFGTKREERIQDAQLGKHQNILDDITATMT